MAINIEDFLCLCVGGGRGGGEGEEFVGHCHSLMHEFAAHVLWCQITYEQRLYKFSSFWGGGGQFQAPPLYETLTCDRLIPSVPRGQVGLKARSTTALSRRWAVCWWCRPSIRRLCRTVSSMQGAMWFSHNWQSQLRTQTGHAAAYNSILYQPYLWIFSELPLSTGHCRTCFKPKKHMLGLEAHWAMEDVLSRTHPVWAQRGPAASWSCCTVAKSPKSKSHSSTLCPTWHHVTINEVMWQSMKSCDIQWSHVTFNAVMWHSMQSCDIQCSHVTFNEVMWHSMKSCDFQWSHVTINEVMWHSMKSCDIQWSHVTFNEVMWLSMKSCDNQWSHVTFNEVMWHRPQVRAAFSLVFLLFPAAVIYLWGMSPWQQCMSLASSCL